MPITVRSKYENNWESKSLEHLEKDKWAEPNTDSHLVKTCHLLRKKPINEFDSEDLRVMIGQNIGLKYLIPLALDILQDDIFAEGAYYEGDLLKSVLTCHKDFWKNENALFADLKELIYKNESLLSEGAPELLEYFCAI